MTAPHPPQLPTLRHKPSWTNRAGRFDRSACVEVRASDLWPTTTLKPAPTFAGREAAATTTLTAHTLATLHDQRPPRPLVGDYRTAKSNAMKPAPDHPHRHPSQGQTNNARGPDHQLTPNPNRGASRTKQLGLTNNWSQEITIERWRLHKKLAQHFLICPRCKKKFLKLFLVLATPDELRDAPTAHHWLNAHAPYTRHPSHRTPPPQSPTRQTALNLLNRYAPLFPPRQLQCRHCLNLRYGEAKRKKSKLKK